MSGTPDSLSRGTGTGLGRRRRRRRREEFFNHYKNDIKRHAHTL